MWDLQILAQSRNIIYFSEELLISIYYYKLQSPFTPVSDKIPQHTTTKMIQVLHLWNLQVLALKLGEKMAHINSLLHFFSLAKNMPKSKSF